MRRTLAFALVAVVSCGKGSPPGDAAPSVSLAASSPPAPAAPSASAAKEAAIALSRQLQGPLFRVTGVPGVTLIEQNQAIFRITPGKIVQDPGWLRGLPRGADERLWQGAADGPLYAVLVTNDTTAEGHYFSSAYRRINDQWVDSKLTSTDGYETMIDVAPWGEGRHLGLVVLRRVSDMRFALAGGKGPVALPRFTPLPPLPRAAASSAPRPPPATPTPPGSAAPRASSSAAASGGFVPFAPPPEASAAARADEPAADPRGCAQRLGLQLGGQRLSDKRLGALPTGHVFVAGSDCGELPADAASAPAVERWAPGARQSTFDRLPAPASPLVDLWLQVAAPDRAFVAGQTRDGSPYLAVFDGQSWKSEAPPIAGPLAGTLSLDASGNLWLAAGKQLARRSPGGAWVTASLPAEARSLRTLGDEVWVSTSDEVLSTRKAPAEAPALGKVRVFDDGGEGLVLIGSTPFCEQTTALLLVLGPTPFKPPGSHPLAEGLRGKLAPGVEVAVIELEGTAYLALQGKSVEDVRQGVAAAREKNPRAFDRVVCLSPKRLATYP